MHLEDHAEASFPRKAPLDGREETLSEAAPAGFGVDVHRVDGSDFPPAVDEGPHKADELAFLDKLQVDASRALERVPVILDVVGDFWRVACPLEGQEPFEVAGTRLDDAGGQRNPPIVGASRKSAS